METFLWIALFAWLGRKAWKWVKLRCAQIDYENEFIAELRQSILNGEIKWPQS